LPEEEQKGESSRKAASSVVEKMMKQALTKELDTDQTS